MSESVGKALYGAIFVVIVPAVLVLWGLRLEALGVVAWSQPLPALLGPIACAAGGALMAVSMHALWRHGGGLPMNAYPPRRFVARSSYAFFSHPIYVGFSICVAGVSIAANSAAGLWIVTPAVALCCVALVLGYEAPALHARFGRRAGAPYFGVPPASAAPAPMPLRLCAGLTVFVPWAVLYTVFSLMPAPHGAAELRLAFEHAFPVQSWAVWVYTLAYPFSALAPLALASLADLRRFVICGWWATAAGFFLMLYLPGQAVFLPTAWTGVEAWLEWGNRLADAEWLAMPSFHVIWALIAAHCYGTRRAGLAWAAFGFAAAVAASSVLTGAHALVDVLGGAGVAYLCWHYDRSWAFVLHWAERLANSWSGFRAGNVRIINHSAWSAAAMSAGSALALYLAGSDYAAEIAFVCMASLIGAGAWGYALEGGNGLARPFGYFGGLLGAALGLGFLLAIADGGQLWAIAVGVAVGGAITQALGRGRCLVQGCCHGRPLEGGHGIRVDNDHSRVVALAGLKGVSLYATQLYSMIANAAIAIVLLHLCTAGASAPIVVAAYLVLTSIARFIEEGYRGEPQTPRLAGLPIYQWLAVAMLLCGVALSFVAGPRFQPANALSPASVSVALLLGLAAVLALSVDFPDSKKPLSRLTVIQEPPEIRC